MLNYDNPNMSYVRIGYFVLTMYLFRYIFDRVFNTDEGNKKVYEDVGFDIIEAAVSGFNSTIFAYGQTASGKTHTMLGSESEKGILREAVEHIFDAIEQETQKQFALRCSYIEIYNENITDLLVPKDSRRKSKLRIMDDTDGSVNIEGMEFFETHF